MKEQNKKEHTQVFSLLEKIDDKLDKLPEKFVTRMEFKAAMWIAWFLATIIWVISYFIFST